MRDEETKTRWCVAQTKPREEEIAVAHLRRQSFEVFLPLLQERRGTEARIIPMFPGYVFVAINPLSLDYLPISSTRGVKRLMTSCLERPALLPAGWVEALRDQGMLDEFTDSLSFRKGERVQFIAGPFEGRVGTCQWTSDRRVKLMLDMLGREVTVYSEPKMLKRVTDPAK